MTSADDLWPFIRDIPDFPRPGVVFRDITPLLGDAEAFRTATELMAVPFDDPTRPITKVIGIEARGFILAAPDRLRWAPGSSPCARRASSRGTPTGTATSSSTGTTHSRCTANALTPDDRVLIVDDVLATGGTATATCRLVAEFFAATVVGVTFLLELPVLGGREQLLPLGHRVESVLIAVIRLTRTALDPGADLVAGVGGCALAEPVHHVARHRHQCRGVQHEIDGGVDRQRAQRRGHVPVAGREVGPALTHVVERDPRSSARRPRSSSPVNAAHTSSGDVGRCAMTPTSPTPGLLRLTEQPQQRAPALAGAHVVHDVDVALQRPQLTRHETGTTERLPADVLPRVADHQEVRRSVRRQEITALGALGIPVLPLVGHVVVHAAVGEHELADRHGRLAPRSPRTCQPHPEAVEVQLDRRERQRQRGRRPHRGGQAQLARCAFARVPLGDDLRRQEALVTRLQLGGAEHVAGVGGVHVGQEPSVEQRVVEGALEDRAAAVPAARRRGRVSTAVPTMSARTRIQAASPWVSPPKPHVSAPTVTTTITATNAAACRSATASPMPTSAPIPSHSGSSHANPGVPRAR